MNERSPRHRRTTTSFAAVSITVLLAACGSDASLQERSADAVNAYVADDATLSDAGFDADCVASTARGLPDDIAQAVIDDRGRIDFDVDERDRDDVYDFYNCADERDLARAIEDDLDGTVSGDCLRDAFDAQGASDFLNAADGDDPGRLGDFDNVASTTCGDATPPPDPPETTTTTTTLPPDTTTSTTTTSTTSTTTTTTTTAPSTAPPTTQPQAMPDASTPADFASETASFLNDDPQVSTAVGSDVNSVVCTPPSRTTVGTNYLCFGQAAGFGAIEFTVEIDAVDSFLVTDFAPAFSGPKTLFFTTVVSGLVDEDLQVDQVCVRNVVDGLAEGDVQIVVDNINAPELPDGLGFDEDSLATLLIGCVSP